MTFFNFHWASNKLLWGVMFLLIISACGTSERAAKNEEAPPPKEEVRVSPSANYPVDENLNSPKPEPGTLLFARENGIESVRLIERGRASWYGPNFDGKLTANGEQYDMYGMTAAHRTLPFNTLVVVENSDSGKLVLVRINDRGPFAKNRIIDLSKKAAQKIGMIAPGTANVNIFVGANALKNNAPANIKVASFTVQLGSFATKAKAFNHSSKIRGSRVKTIRTKERTFYRVYYGLYFDKEQASEKLRELQRKNISGYVKQLENG
jgi:rare lipoprotein A